MKRWQLVEVVAVVAAVAAVASGSLLGCEVSDGDARRALEASGFDDITLTGYAWFACGKDDAFASSFRAVNARGAEVSGVVCCGLWKSCTVRF
jgi:hypothetical protein